MTDLNLKKEIRVAENEASVEIAESADVEKRVAGVIAKHVDDAAKVIKPESGLGSDLGFDSLDSVELVMSLEEEFNVEIPDEDAAKMKTVGDVMHYIKAALRNG
ncbi:MULTISPECIES: acyl carrier protein [unclassified Candidatus Lariskella]|uniref:acyl carrier protein n=1 Tax=unclassified Candidatus Lariskella TaxID=2632605 RepID=UPI0030CD35E1